jgi:hypothetical protein
MPVGQQIDKATVDAQVASLAKQLTAIFGNVQVFTTHMDAVVDATLTAMGYSAGEISLLRSAYRDMDKLRQVWQGLMFVTSGATANNGVPTANGAGAFGYDFRAFTKQVDGIGY